MNGKYYLLVEVTYDYYRFEKNIRLFTSLVDCLGFSEYYIAGQEYDFQRKREVRMYGVEDSEVFAPLQDNEEDHYWIQEFDKDGEPIKNIQYE